MSGRSRSFYHGVPRIMEGTLPKYFEIDETDGEVGRACKRFMAGAR
jgi:alkylated DNA repair protein alkB family protein 1